MFYSSCQGTLTKDLGYEALGKTEIWKSDPRMLHYEV